MACPTRAFSVVANQRKKASDSRKVLQRFVKRRYVYVVQQDPIRDMVVSVE